MAGYLLCIESESGVPIFARKVGDISPIEFPLAASLNGVCVFGKAQGVQLLTTMTQSTRSIWKQFHDRISLIFVGTDDTPSEVHMNHLLNSVFNVIVFHVGLEFLLSTTSVEKLKRELRMCYPMIDKLLQGLRPSELTLYFGDLTRCMDVFLAVDPSVQSLIDSFSGTNTSSYVCLSSRGTILAATRDWTSMKGEEGVLLLFKAHEMTAPCTQMNVFLSSGHTLAFRLIVFRFTETLRLSLLCGQDPPLRHLKKEVRKLELKAGELFLEMEDLATRMAASYKYLVLDQSIAGFLIVNMMTHRCAFALSGETQTFRLKPTQKLETLRVFYRNTVDSIFPLHPKIFNKGEPIVKESIWASDYHKCHALRAFPYQLFVIYETETSHALMRNTSQRLLQELIKDKAIK